MNPFLSAAWLQVMQASGAVSGCVEIPCAEGSAWVGEARMFGMRKWVLYGEFGQDARDLWQQLLQRAKAAPVFRVESTFNMSRWREDHFWPEGIRRLQSFGTYALDLTQSEADLWQGVHGKHRNMIRRAEREGVVVENRLDLTLFHDLLLQTYGRGGKTPGYSLAYLESLQRHLGENLVMAGAYKAGELMAGLLVPFGCQRGYYLHGATRPGGTPGASNLLHWQVMRQLRHKGVGVYDLGGARLQTDDPRLRGIFQFKQRFGGVYEPCIYWEKVIRPVTDSLFRAVEKVRPLLHRT